jgi:hypothetical protein
MCEVIQSVVRVQRVKCIVARSECFIPMVTTFSYFYVQKNNKECLNRMTSWLQYVMDLKRKLRFCSTCLWTS